MGVASILLATGGVMLLLAIHPLVTYPLSLMLLPRRPSWASGDGDASTRPSLAICLSVYNEEAVIVGKVETLLRQAALYGPARVYIYTDGCSDASASLLRQYEDRLHLVVSTERRGKTAGMQTLIEMSDSELLLFTDANVDASDDSAIELARPFADPDVGCVTARLAYTNAGDTATSLLGTLYWRIEEWVKRQEDRTVGVIGVDGAMFVIRRANYHAPPPSLIDDLYVSLKVLIDGKRVTRMPNVVVAERSATDSHEEARRKTRIACQAMNVHVALWSSIRRLPVATTYGYLSHRLLKWLMPFTLFGAAIALAASAAVAFGLALTAGAIGAAALVFVAAWVLRLSAARVAASAAVGLVGVGRGVIESLAGGRTYTTWEPASSVRLDKWEPPVERLPSATRSAGLAPADRPDGSAV